ncbi:TetR/AcrR family transcriptional regulator [Acetanaerobacterium elongatum]|uniref:Transcriptional regulator, TetR family n=1 Tax=Acetanaerobacterium elongatum TaxID=258515 RepID=A0A1H0EEX5_9FIRM|nr:TetR/AcrR family transcriptional regulator [Acetanaerobacterium elongatum]SDN80826.1 transcriptional regulator, TetR family [Acetanaerobacterium elongatum]
MALIRDLNEKMLYKRTSLIEAARYLFVEQGIQNTSIDAIVKRANVAKGTFYLYFEDKDDILDEIVYEINRAILLKAVRSARALDSGDFTQRFIHMIDSIINHFIDNQHELKLIRKNFSWPVVKKRLNCVQEDTELAEALDSLSKNLHMTNYNSDEAKNIILATVEMCGALCYSCIINKQPIDIETMKPTLYRMIQKLLD